MSFYGYDPARYQQNFGWVADIAKNIGVAVGDVINTQEALKQGRAKVQDFYGQIYQQAVKELQDAGVADPQGTAAKHFPPPTKFELNDPDGKLILVRLGSNEKKHQDFLAQQKQKQTGQQIATATRSALGAEPGVPQALIQTAPRGPSMALLGTPGRPAPATQEEFQQRFAEQELPAGVTQQQVQAEPTYAAAVAGLPTQAQATAQQRAAQTAEDARQRNERLGRESDARLAKYEADAKLAVQKFKTAKTREERLRAKDFLSTVDERRVRSDVQALTRLHNQRLMEYEHAKDNPNTAPEVLAELKGKEQASRKRLKDAQARMARVVEALELLAAGPVEEREPTVTAGSFGVRAGQAAPTGTQVERARARLVAAGATEEEIAAVLARLTGD